MKEMRLALVTALFALTNCGGPEPVYYTEPPEPPEADVRFDVYGDDPPNFDEYVTDRGRAVLKNNETVLVAYMKDLSYDGDWQFMVRIPSKLTLGTYPVTSVTFGYTERTLTDDILQQLFPPENRGISGSIEILKLDPVNLVVHNLEIYGGLGTTYFLDGTAIWYDIEYRD